MYFFFFFFFLGWQPRWFVLDGGTLSYYDSQEDAWKGCKGSIKISVCEIQGRYGSLFPLYCVSLCKCEYLVSYCLLDVVLTSIFHISIF